jgi:predicted DCC family thiol-disulfide oxidoreductase YuxK
MTTSPSEKSPADPVLLFDGECGLCQRVVRFLLRIDGEGHLRFSPLQGPAAQAFLREQHLATTDFDSVLWVPDWSRRHTQPYLQRTESIIAALRVCGRIGRMLATLIALWPPKWRDAIYRTIGHIRYRIFGPWHPHPLPRPEWARRFVT